MSTIPFNYKLASDAGYKMEITKIGEFQYDDLAYYHKENFPDVKITRPGIPTSLETLHTHCLMTVNGYIHLTSYLEDTLYVNKATSSMLKSRSNHIGILSFSQLTSPLTKISITDDMITSEVNVPLYEKAIITFTEEVNYPILVIAGYMIFEEPEFFYRVSSTSFVLRLDRLNYIQKLYELSRQVNIFNELEIPVSPNNSTVVDAAVTRSDVVIRRFLTRHNSFLVDLPVTSLNVSKTYLERTSVPGNYRFLKQPTSVVIGGYGKIIEYTSRQNNDKTYTIYTRDAYYDNHVLNKMSTEAIGLYNDHREVGSTYRLSPGFFLNLSTEA